VVAEAFDQEGIVRAVSRALHAARANIVSLETTAYEAPVTGSPLFRMEARIDVPKGLLEFGKTIPVGKK
jgi:glycine cleavage system transcriptional repressor